MEVGEKFICVNSVHREGNRRLYNACIMSDHRRLYQGYLDFSMLVVARWLSERVYNVRCNVAHALQLPMHGGTRAPPSTSQLRQHDYLKQQTQGSNPRRLRDSLAGSVDRRLYSYPQ
jgi:hypothetical protein